MNYKKKFPQEGLISNRDYRYAYRFIVDSANDVNPNDFYNAYLEIDFRIVCGDNAVLVAADNIALAGDRYSLIIQMNVTINGVTLVTQTQANLAIDIPNKAKYSVPYVNDPATNTMFFPDSARAVASASIVTKKNLLHCQRQLQFYFH